MTYTIVLFEGGLIPKNPELAGEPLGRFNSCANKGGVADPQYNKFPIDRQVFRRKPDTPPQSAKLDLQFFSCVVYFLKSRKLWGGEYGTEEKFRYGGRIRRP
jgi:hypothetical protein